MVVVFRVVEAGVIVAAGVVRAGVVVAGVIGAVCAACKAVPSIHPPPTCDLPAQI